MLLVTCTHKIIWDWTNNGKVINWSDFPMYATWINEDWGLSAPPWLTATGRYTFSESSVMRAPSPALSRNDIRLELRTQQDHQTEVPQQTQLLQTFLSCLHIAVFILHFYTEVFITYIMCIYNIHTHTCGIWYTLYMCSFIYVIHHDNEYTEANTFLQLNKLNVHYSVNILPFVTLL